MKVQENLPAHVGIIMDGNGRWAEKRNRSRNYGHRVGVEVLEDISKYADNIGIKYLSVYAFSTENWNRPKKEVDNLMNLLRRYLKRHIKQADKNNLKVIITGERSLLSPDIVELIEEIESLTKDKDGMTFNIAINYGGQDEIIRSIKKIALDLEKESIKREDINEELFVKYLDTSNIPNADFIIRTSGEQRLSNFLTWQSAYSELYFTNCLWPDFNTEELDKALLEFSKRKRRYGKIE